MDISMANNTLPRQQATESVDVKAAGSAETILETSPTTSAQTIEAVEEAKSVSAVESEQQQVDGEELKSAVVELNKAVQNVQRNLEFSVDDITGRTVVQVKDRATDEVIRQMPSEEALKLAQHVLEQQPESGTEFSLMQELKA